MQGGVNNEVYIDIEEKVWVRGGTGTDGVTSIVARIVWGEGKGGVLRGLMRFMIQQKK